MKGMAGKTWMLTDEEKNTYWQVLEDVKNTFLRLQLKGGLPADWNDHDLGIVMELEKQARPFSAGGTQQRDPNTSQLRKHFRATVKLFLLHSIQISFKEYVALLGITRNNNKMSAWQIRNHMDQRRALAAKYSVTLDENR